LKSSQEAIMIGTTLTSEQIRSAPPEVRRWIEREVITSFGQQPQPAEDSKPNGEHLAACSIEEAAAILSQIQGVLPAVNVFFELGRQGAIFGQPNIEAFRLLDIAHHTRLPDVTQVVACLNIISEAFGRVCADATARLCGLDSEGRCFIALQTQQNILRLWQQVVANQQLTSQGESELAAAPQPGGAIAGNEAPVTSPPRQPAFESKVAAA
jgi:hypothetical protein